MKYICFVSLALLSLVINARVAFAHSEQELSHTIEINSSTISTIQQAIASQHWRLMTEKDHQVIDDKTVWLKLTLPVSTATTEQQAILINNPLLDHITVYQVQQGSISQTVHLGDNIPFSARPIASTNFIVPFYRDHQIQTFYLQVSSSGNLNLPIHVVNLKQLTERLELRALIDGLQLGGLIIISIFTVLIALLSRSKSYIYYSCYVFTITLLAASLNGYAFRFLWPQLPQVQQLIIPVLIPVILALALMFTEQVLRLKNDAVKLSKTCKGLTITMILIGIMSQFISYTHALFTNMLMAIIVAVTMTFIATLQGAKQHKMAKLFAIAWGCLLIGTCWSGALYIGIATSHMQPQMPIMIGLTLEILIMGFILAVRFNDERQQKQKMQQDALYQAEQIKIAKEEALYLKNISHDRLERMVHERTIKLEKTLKELSIANTKLVELSTSDALTGVNNRVSFDETLLYQCKLSRRYQASLALLILDIDEFKQVNDTHGHLAGDEVLIQLARNIAKHLKRPSDHLSRFGGEEFVIILPNTDIDGALSVAESIRQAIENLSIPWQEHKLNITVSIGVSVAIIQDTCQPHKLLDQADKALYRAKRLGRNQVCLYSPAIETQ